MSIVSTTTLVGAILVMLEDIVITTSMTAPHLLVFTVSMLIISTAIGFTRTFGFDLYDDSFFPVYYFDILYQVSLYMSTLNSPRMKMCR